MIKTNFPLHTADSAPEPSRALLNEVQKSFGMTPNLFRVMSGSPSLFKAYMATSDAFSKSTLTPVEQQVVLITASALNGCTYCVGAHSVIADMSGVPAAVTTSLRDRTAIADSKLEALRLFTASLVENRGWVDEQAVRAFLAAGYSQESLFDVIAGVGLKTMSNYMNHVAQTPLDQAFTARQWTN